MSLDRPESDRSRDYVGALAGSCPRARAMPIRCLTTRSSVARDSWPRRHARPIWLEALLADCRDPGRGAPVRRRVARHSGPRSIAAWETELAVLGTSATLGAATWLTPAQFEIVLGPLGTDEFVNFLPGVSWGSSTALAGAPVHRRVGLAAPQQQDRTFPAMSYRWQPASGWMSWLGERRADAHDVVTGTARRWRAIA